MAALNMNTKAWYDKAFISIAKQAGTENQLRAKTTSLNITGGNFDVESIETFGGKVKRLGTREDFEISFEGIPTSLQDFDWMFHGGSAGDVSITTSSISDFRIAILWTDESGITDATQAIATASEAYREYYAEANLVSLEKSMDAGEHLKADMTFKCPFEDSDGSQNFKFEVCNTASTLGSASAYTSTNKF